MISQLTRPGTGLITVNWTSALKGITGKAHRVMRTRWERNGSPCYILPEIQSEERKKPEEDSGFFVFVKEKEHNILWSTKKTALFSLFFSGERPLSGKESCGIMTVTDEFGRGKP
jgi:hypothetical protein